MGRFLSLSHGVRRDSSLIRGSRGVSEPPSGRRRRRTAQSPTGWGWGAFLSLSHGVRRDSSLIRGGRGGPSVRCASGRRGAPPFGRRRRRHAFALQWSWVDGTQRERRGLAPAPACQKTMSSRGGRSPTWRSPNYLGQFSIHFPTDRGIPTTSLRTGLGMTPLF